jgi:drug/metabolite transporter (DMT)-like permease
VGGALVGLASLQFGGVVILGKIVTEGGLAVPSFLAFRFAAGCFLLGAVLLVVRQPLSAASGERWPLAGLGAVGYALEAGLFFAAVQFGTAAAVTLLFFTYPVWVAVLSAAMGKGAPGRLVVGALVAAVVGAAIVVVSGGGLDITAAGVLLALGSAVTFAVYLAGADAVVRRTPSLTSAFWVSGASAAALFAFSLLTRTAEWPTGWRQWGPVLATAAFTSGAFVCLFAGLRRLGAVRTSIVAASEPLAATAMAVVFLGEPIRAGVLVGGVLILGGAVAASLARRQPAPGPPVP